MLRHDATPSDPLLPESGTARIYNAGIDAAAGTDAATGTDTQSLRAEDSVTEDSEALVNTEAPRGSNRCLSILGAAACVVVPAAVGEGARMLVDTFLPVGMDPVDRDMISGSTGSALNLATAILANYLRDRRRPSFFTALNTLNVAGGVLGVFGFIKYHVGLTETAARTAYDTATSFVSYAAASDFFRHYAHQDTEIRAHQENPAPAPGPSMV